MAAVLVQITHIDYDRPAPLAEGIKKYFGLSGRLHSSKRSELMRSQKIYRRIEVAAQDGLRPTQIRISS